MSDYSSEEEGQEEELPAGGLGPDNEFYGFLNVPRSVQKLDEVHVDPPSLRTATQAEITSAYKKFARLFHPDKHQDPAKRAQAELLFSKLKHAHEVWSLY